MHERNWFDWAFALVFGGALVLIIVVAFFTFRDQQRAEAACTKRGGTIRYATKVRDGYEVKGWYCVPNEVERAP